MSFSSEPRAWFDRRNTEQEERYPELKLASPDMVSRVDALRVERGELPSAMTRDTTSLAAQLTSVRGGRGDGGNNFLSSLSNLYAPAPDDPNAPDAAPNVEPWQPKTTGQLSSGNIDLSNRPHVKNDDGSISTVRSISIEEDGRTILIPTVVGNRVVSPMEAIQHYRDTGEHLGMFGDTESANQYAQQLHEEQAGTLNTSNDQYGSSLDEMQAGQRDLEAARQGRFTPPPERPGFQGNGIGQTAFNALDTIIPQKRANQIDWQTDAHGRVVTPSPVSQEDLVGAVAGVGDAPIPILRAAGAAIGGIAAPWLANKGLGAAGVHDPRVRGAVDAVAGIGGALVGDRVGPRAPGAVAAIDSAFAPANLRGAAPEAFERGRGNYRRDGTTHALTRGAGVPEDITPRQTMVYPDRIAGGIAGGADDLPPLTVDDVREVVNRKVADGMTPAEAMQDPEVQAIAGRLFRPDYNATPEGPATAADIAKNLQRARNAEPAAASASVNGGTEASLPDLDTLEAKLRSEGMTPENRAAAMNYLAREAGNNQEAVRAVNNWTDLRPQVNRLRAMASDAAPSATADPFARFDRPIEARAGAIGDASPSVIGADRIAQLRAQAQARAARPVPKFPLAGGPAGGSGDIPNADLFGGRNIPGGQGRPSLPTSSTTSQAADRAATEAYAKSIRNQPNTSDEQEVVKLWHAGNRQILDTIKNDRPLGIGVEAAISGDLPDSFVSSALHRKAVLRSALEQSGAPANIVKEATDEAFNRELTIHYGGPNKVPDDVKAMIERTRSGNGPSGDELSTLDTFNQRAKNTMFGLTDFGVLGGQVHNLARRGGIPLIEGAINRTLAALNLPHIATEIADSNLPRSLQNAVDGVHQGSGPAAARPEVGTMLSYLGKYGKAIDRKYVIPVSDAMTRVQFQNILTPLRNLTHEGDLVTLHLLGRDIQNPRVRAEAAANANVLSSFAEQALQAGRRSAESKAFTSASMTRSKVRQITQMAKLISPKASPEQRILAAQTIASTFVLYTAVAKFLNDQIGTTPMQFDPSKPGYGVITTNVRDKDGKRTQIDIVPSDAVDRAFAQSVRALADPNVDDLEAQRAWERVAIGAGSILTRGALAAGTRTGYEPGKGYRYGNMSGTGIIQSVLPTPPSIQNLTQGASPLEQGLGAFGVSSYPENVGGSSGSAGRPTRPSRPARPSVTR